MNKNILFLLSLCFVILSCQKDIVPSITLNQTEFTVSDAGGSQSISFEANLNWTAKSSETWCAVSPASGDASIKSIIVTIKPNDTFDDRSCTVTITVEGLSKTLTINQSADSGLIVTKEKYDLSNDAATIEVEVKANVEFDVIISDGWITKVTTRGLSSTKLQFNIAKNKSYDNRNGSIIIKQKDGDLTSTIKVYQSQLDGIILSNKKAVLSSDIQTLEIELKTNVDFEVVIPEAAKSWVSYIGTRALKSETFSLIIAKNTGYEARTTNIYVKNKTTSLQDTLIIIQSADLGLIVTKDKYDLSNDATTIEVEVKSNVEFEISISDSWISKFTTRGLTSSKHQFIIAKNTSYDNREGSIIIKQKGGTLTKTINVYQSQKDAIIISNKRADLSSNSQTLDVELKTNVDFEVIIPEAAKSWVSYTPTRVLRTETILLNIAENKADKVRATEVYVKNKTTSLQDTLRINQDKAPELPTLTTLDAYDILISSAKSGGKISNDEKAPILSKGVCWSTSKNPTIQDSKTINGLGADNFISDIIDLKAKTTYYVRAYATNKVGTSYGNQISFTTTSKVATPVISPNGGSYTIAQTVTINCATPGALIRYTLDGSDPTESSQLYTGGIPIDYEVTIKAKAFKLNWQESSVATQTYILKLSSLLIEGTSNEIQHIITPRNFTLRLDNLDNKNVFFIFSNKNTQNSTTLPQLQNNVPTMKSVRNTTALPESSFLISGKPSITDFNNNPLKYPMKGMSKPEYQKYSVSHQEKYVVGSSERLYEELGSTQLSTVRKIISAHGKNLYVWVADNCWGSNSTKTYFVTQQMVDALATNFLNTGTDNDIYEWVTNICGDSWGKTGKSNLIPETDDIHIWLTDIDNDDKVFGQVTLGYFYARDNYLKSSISTSNEKLMFTIDAVLFATTTNGSWDVSHYMPKMLISTLAHEFTHMIYFYQNNILNNQTGNTTISEMTAQCVEDLVANKILTNGPRGVLYSTSNSGNPGNSSGRFPLFNANNDYNLLNWSLDPSEGLVNYSKTYALGSYLMRNYGGAKFIRELVQNNSTGVSSIVSAVNSNGGAGLTYEDILQRFGAAYLLSDKTTMGSGYRFNTGGWNTSTINGITYNLGSINFYNYSPPPYVYTELPSTQKSGSNIYYRAGRNLTGAKEWTFEGMSSDTKLTVVIK